jgi:hypothetical protein
MYHEADLPRSMSSGSSRPRTPPLSSKSKADYTPPISKTSSGLASPPRRTYTEFLSNTNNDWDANDEDDEDEYAYDDDGDDFGLPSVSTLRRKPKRLPDQSSIDPGGSLSPWGSSSRENYLGNRRYSNSADIAIERPAPSYPLTKNGEGKILRPQYKEILRGEL